MIEVRNVCKNFEGKQVLKNISVKLEPGVNNLIIGQSGSGKTVLLKCLLGLHKIDSGEIYFDGRNFTAMNDNEQKNIRKEIGTVFQGGALFDSMTVEENVMFPLDMFTSQTRQQKKDRVNFCLRRVDLQHSNKLMPSEISGGMKKRVAIARPLL